MRIFLFSFFFSSVAAVGYHDGEVSRRGNHSSSRPRPLHSCTNMNLVPQLPQEINDKIIAYARGRSDALYKTLRLVSKGINFYATERLLESQLINLEKAVTAAQTELAAKWNENPSEKEGKILEELFNEFAKRSEDLKRLKQQVSNV